MRITAFLAAFLLLGAAHAAAQVGIGGKYRIWQAEVDGDVRADGPTSIGTSIDLGSLDLEEQYLHDASFFGELAGVGRIRLNYWFGTFAEDEVLSPAAFTFNETSFPAGTLLDTEYEVHGMSGMWEYTLAGGPVGMGMYEASLLVGYKYFSMKMDINSPAAHAEGNARGATLAAGARLFTQLASWLYLEAEAYIQTFSIGDADVDYWDVAGELLVNPFGGFYLGAGYRRVDLALKDDRRGSERTREHEIGIEGFFATAQLRF